MLLQILTKLFYNDELGYIKVNDYRMDFKKPYWTITNLLDGSIEVLTDAQLYQKMKEEQKERKVIKKQVKKQLKEEKRNKK